MPWQPYTTLHGTATSIQALSHFLSKNKGNIALCQDYVLFLVEFLCSVLFCPSQSPWFLISPTPISVLFDYIPCVFNPRVSLVACPILLMLVRLFIPSVLLHATCVDLSL